MRSAKVSGSAWKSCVSPQRSAGCRVRTSWRRSTRRPYRTSYAQSATTDRAAPTFSRRIPGALRKDRECSRREPEPVLDLWPRHDDDGAGRRHLVEVRHHFDLEVILFEDPGLRLHRLGRVGVERFVADGRHLALIEQELDRGE